MKVCKEMIFLLTTSYLNHNISMIIKKYSPSIYDICVSELLICSIFKHVIFVFNY